MISLRFALAFPALLLLGAEPDPVRAPAEPIDSLVPACARSGVHGLTADNPTKRSFYLASELTEIRGHLDPVRWIAREPRHIDLLPGDSRCETVTPGIAFDLHDRGVTDHCVATNLRRPEHCFDFDLRCGVTTSAASSGEAGGSDPHARGGRWIWLDAHRALTDLLPAEGWSAFLAEPRAWSSAPFEELALLKDPAYPEYPLQEVVELENPPDIAALRQQARDRDAAAMAGHYQDASGLEMTVTPGGQLYLGKTAVQVTLHRCTSGVYQAPCLVGSDPRESPPGSRAWLLVTRGNRIEMLEGRITDGAGDYSFDRGNRPPFLLDAKGCR